MATLTQQLSVFARVISTSSPVEHQLTDSTAISSLRPHPRLPLTTLRSYSAATAVSRRRYLASVPAAGSMLSGNPVVSDIIAAGISGGIALSLLRFWGETAKRGIFDQVGLPNSSLKILRVFCLFFLPFFWLFRIVTRPRIDLPPLSFQPRVGWQSMHNDALFGVDFAFKQTLFP